MSGTKWQTHSHFSNICDGASWISDKAIGERLFQNFESEKYCHRRGALCCVLGLIKLPPGYSGFAVAEMLGTDEPEYGPHCHWFTSSTGRDCQGTPHEKYADVSLTPDRYILPVILSSAQCLSFYINQAKIIYCKMINKPWTLGIICTLSQWKKINMFKNNQFGWRIFQINICWSLTES